MSHKDEGVPTSDGVISVVLMLVATLLLGAGIVLSADWLVYASLAVALYGAFR